MPLREVEHATRMKKSAHPSESVSHLQHRDKKLVVPLRFGGLGCCRSKSQVSAPAVIRSAAQWDNKQVRKTRHRSKARSSCAKIPGNVVCVPDVCCTPPGIGSASDVAAIPRINAHSTNQHRSAKRNADVSASNTISFRDYMQDNRLHQSEHSRGTPQILMFHDRPICRGSSDMNDRYGDWRLDVDSMSYEQLLELGDRIGYVYTGLQEEEILHCLTKSEHKRLGSLPQLTSIEKDLRCSICQEGWIADNDIGLLECGHLYHIDCIKKWLLQKNICPVCKITAMSKRKLK